MRETFGLPKSPISDIIDKVSDQLYKLPFTEINFPSGAELLEKRKGFFRGICQNNVVMSIDGTHFETTRPKNNPFDFLN